MGRSRGSRGSGRVGVSAIMPKEFELLFFVKVSNILVFVSADHAGL